MKTEVELSRRRKLSQSIEMQVTCEATERVGGMNRKYDTYM